MLQTSVLIWSVLICADLCHLQTRDSTRDRLNGGTTCYFFLQVVPGRLLAAGNPGLSGSADGELRYAGTGQTWCKEHLQW